MHSLESCGTVVLAAMLNLDRKCRSCRSFQMFLFRFSGSESRKWEGLKWNGRKGQREHPPFLLASPLPYTPFAPSSLPTFLLSSSLPCTPSTNLLPFLLFLFPFVYNLLSSCPVFFPLHCPLSFLLAYHNQYICTFSNHQDAPFPSSYMLSNV